MTTKLLASNWPPVGRCDRPITLCNWPPPSRPGAARCGGNEENRRSGAITPGRSANGQVRPPATSAWPPFWEPIKAPNGQAARGQVKP